ncbi:MAG: TonB-dependent receptor plug domain-containing protein [Gemmatimonadetes bacterium]|nr:TonB-dependent receptor plug domain-containing protein [Gemmatimonadota bacterium]NIQ56511.1 TonB-dependent receptor plug domain-containing protein [Gemmatimonadota bacterium]NIU76711.1 TonB-dependent receptor plug domain-containing protein [Gammaproteobacteria bacterium]NIX46121.1 TonB-dependent receptor plug domain-containing protein [Gemmatimonadota bacterium]
MMEWNEQRYFGSTTDWIGEGFMLGRHHHRPAAVPAFVALLLLGTFPGCGLEKAESPRPAGMAPGGTVLTRVEIEEMGARTAMEALERARTHLTIARTREGTPAKITQRGVGSLVLAPDILLVVDGSRVNHVVSMLEAIPTESIVYIQVLTSREAALQWGSESGNGVIVIRTAAAR